MIAEIFYKKYPLLYLLVDPQGVKLEDDPNKAEQLSDKYSLFIESKTNILPNIRQYFNSRLHDSWVLKIDYNNSAVSIQLNEFSTHCFADALSDRYEIRIPHKKRIFPVSLNFNGVKSFSVSWINRNGKILPQLRGCWQTRKAPPLPNSLGNFRNGHSTDIQHYRERSPHPQPVHSI